MLRGKNEKRLSNWNLTNYFTSTSVKRSEVESPLKRTIKNKVFFSYDVVKYS